MFKVHILLESSNKTNHQQSAYAGLYQLKELIDYVIFTNINKLFS